MLTAKDRQEQLRLEKDAFMRKMGILNDKVENKKQRAHVASG